MTAMLFFLGQAVSLLLAAETETLFSDGEDVCYFNVSVRAAGGLIVPRVRNKVEFSVEGPGEIIATDNGDETDFDDFRRPVRRVFNGWAQAIVRAKPGATGEVKVTVKSGGLVSASAKVKVVGK